MKNIKGLFNQTLQIHGYIKKEILTAVYSNSDFLINFDGPVASMVPSKIFEYMSYGKPIISTYSIDDDASLPYLRKYQLACLLDERIAPEENAVILSQFIQDVRGKIVQYNILKNQFQSNTPEIYVSIIDSLLEEE